MTVSTGTTVPRAANPDMMIFRRDDPGREFL